VLSVLLFIIVNISPQTVGYLGHLQRDALKYRGHSQYLSSSITAVCGFQSHYPDTSSRHMIGITWTACIWTKVGATGFDFTSEWKKRSERRPPSRGRRTAKI